MIYCHEKNDEVRIFCGILNPSLRTVSFQFQGFATPKEKQAKRKEFASLYLSKKGETTVNRLVSKLAKSGQLDFLDEKTLDAARAGQMPETMNFHHMVLISWLGGTNKENNLVLMDREFHDNLHTFIYTPLVEKIKDYEALIASGETDLKKIKIILPVFPKVVTTNDLGYVFPKRELNADRKPALAVKETKETSIVKKHKKAKIVTRHSTDRGCRGQMKQRTRS